MQVYTKTNPIDGKVYVGRSSGYAKTPEEVVRRRDAKHHMTEKGYGEAVLDWGLPATIPGGYGKRGYDISYYAIRGREQLQIEMYKSEGRSGNAINGIATSNTKRQQYLDAAKKYLNHGK